MKLRWHGNGFIQVHLSDLERIHIWTRRFQPTVKNAQIHDHRFGFVSKVLYGTLENAVFDLDYNDKGAYKIWMCKHGAEKSQGLSLDGCADLKLQGRHTVKVGQTYEMHAATFHRSTPLTPLVVTHMVRGESFPHKAARVGCLRDAAPDNAHDPKKTPSQGEMAEEVIWVLGRVLVGIKGIEI